MNIGNEPNEKFVKSVVKQDAREINIKEILLIIKKYYRYLLSKWSIIILIGLCGAVIGWTYATFKKPLYIATTTFVLENADNGGSVGQYAGLASMVGIDLGAGGGGVFQGDNIIELYKSRTMLKRTLLSYIIIDGQKQLLIDRYIKSNNLQEEWNKSPSLRNLQFAPSISYSRIQDSIITQITKVINRDYLFVGKPDKKLSIISVEVKGNDETFVKIFNEQIVKNVNDFYVQTKIKKSSDNISILRLKTDSVRKQLNLNIYSSAVVADETPNLNPTRLQQRTVPTQKLQVSSETNRSILAELIKNLEMAKISLLKETPLIQIIDSPVYPLELQRLSRFKAVLIGGSLAIFLTLIVILLRKAFTDLIK